MFLAFDIGNTNIKAGTFEGPELTGFEVFSKNDDPSSKLRALNIDNAAVSSVVPESTLELTRIIKKELKISPFVISKDNMFNLKINYDTPETLGIDRICSAEGAFCIYKKSENSRAFSPGTFLITVDFGTATTVNIVRYPGEFIGGIISPGIKTMISSLNLNTAQLPETDFGSYKDIIGKDTESSIASGVINSTIGSIDRVFSYLNSELNASSIHTYITGGNAEIILPYLNFPYRFEKGLVLKGIKAIFDLNR